MSTTNLLSKLIKTNKTETVEGLNKALDCMGIQVRSNGLSSFQANKIGNMLVEKLTEIADLQKVAESIKENSTVEELEKFKSELKLTMGSVAYSSNSSSRLGTLKSSFEEVSGDNVI
jgi:hypothetical protein